MITHLTILTVFAATVACFTSLSFFQCLVIALLFYIARMVYALVEEVEFYEEEEK